MKIDLEDGQSLVWRNKTIGYWRKTDTGFVLIMPRIKIKHRMNMYGSYGIAKEILDVLASTIQIIEMRVVVDGGLETLITCPYNWSKKRTTHQSEGYEVQVHLKEEDFETWCK